MDWYVVDKEYINYLKQFDPHVGILLTIGRFNYYVPISSAKPKHSKMSNSLDFHKLQDNTTKYLYTVLNINNMIPVPDECITQLKYNHIEEFRSFVNEKEKTDYIYLLQKEKALIDQAQDILQNKAMKLYKKCISKPDSSLATRCCDFMILEEKCNAYAIFSLKKTADSSFLNQQSFFIYYQQPINS